MVVIRAGIQQIACQNNKKREDTDQYGSCSLVCAVCLYLFGMQLMFVILEHRPYYDIFF